MTKYLLETHKIVKRAQSNCLLYQIKFFSWIYVNVEITSLIDEIQALDLYYCNLNMNLKVPTVTDISSTNQRTFHFKVLILFHRQNVSEFNIQKHHNVFHKICQSVSFHKGDFFFNFESRHSVYHRDGWIVEKRISTWLLQSMFDSILKFCDFWCWSKYISWTTLWNLSYIQ